MINDKPRRLYSYLLLILRGFVIGSVDIVPGVSGGTAAFVLGIYYELLESISSVINAEFWKALLQRQWHSAIRVSNLYFLVAVSIGALLGIVTLARGLEWLFQEYPVYLNSLFIGLVCGSCYVVARRIHRWHYTLAVFIAIGIATGYAISLLSDGGETPNTYWFIFISGATAALALILPGISGAYILLILGKYHQTISAINDGDFVFLLFLGSGVLISIVTFSRIISLLLKRWYLQTASLMLGFIVGSIPLLWPWRGTDNSNIVLPTIGTDLVLAVGMALLGIIVVVVVEFFVSRKQN